jgi:hypothetical protein
MAQKSIKSMTKQDAIKILNVLIENIDEELRQKLNVEVLVALEELELEYEDIGIKEVLSVIAKKEEEKKCEKREDGAGYVSFLKTLIYNKGVWSDEMSSFTYDTEKYEKAILVTGDTKPHKDAMKACGGKWNSSLKGWIFSKKMLEKESKT